MAAFVTATRALRRLVEARIERDLALLDALDGDPDLEPDACAELAVQPVSLRGGSAVSQPDPARRGFLRGLAALPLVGDSVTIIGSPTASAEPVTRDLLESYN